MKGEPEVVLARQIDKASAELAGSMSERVRPELAWWLLLHLSSAGAAQIHVLPGCGRVAPDDSVASRPIR